MTNTLTKWLLGTSINHLVRAQKVGIVGGIPCHEDMGIGLGPEEWKVCYKGRAFWIYHWEEVQKLGKLDGAGVKRPHGLKQLGSGDFALLNFTDVIVSSLASWEAAGLDYSKDTQNQAIERVLEAIKDGNKDVFEPSWEGVFNIPVCNVELVPYLGDFSHKGDVLKDYGKSHEPRWCGPICSIDQGETDKFLKAANMENFDDNPKDHC